MRPIGLAKVKRMVLEVRTSHDGRLLRLEANWAGVGCEDGVEDKRGLLNRGPFASRMWRGYC